MTVDQLQCALGDGCKCTEPEEAWVCRHTKPPEHEAAAPTPLVEEYVMVPREITLDMQHAYFDVIDANLKRVETDAGFGRYSNNAVAYRAMIAAAPPASTAQAQRIAELEFVMADVGGMLDLFDGLGTSNERADLSAFSDRIEAIALREQEARAGLEKARELAAEVVNANHGPSRIALQRAIAKLASLNTGARSE